MASIAEVATPRLTVREPKPKRRFRVSDAMILVAATAAGLGAMEAYANHVWDESLRDVVMQPEDYNLFMTAFFVILTAVPTAIMWSLALIPIRLIGPRPRFRRLAQQPGLSASLAVAIVFLGLAIFEICLALRIGEDALNNELFLILIPVFPGVAVLASWMALATSGAWRAEADWVDRAGRGLGVLWLVLALTGSGLWFCCTARQSLCTVNRSIPMPTLSLPAQSAPPADSPFRQPDPGR